MTVGTTISRWRSLALSTSLLLAITRIAGGSGSEPPASAPAAASQAPAPTAAPTPTATQAPAPTAKPDPTATPVPDKTAPEVQLEGLAVRPFPDELLFDSERLSVAEVEAIYTEYLGGMRHVSFGGQAINDTCSDGSGVLVTDIVAAYTGEPFTWDVEKDRGGRWNEVIVRLTFGPDGPIDGTVRLILDVPEDGVSQTQTYSGTAEYEGLESPLCE